MGSGVTQHRIRRLVTALAYVPELIAGVSMLSITAILFCGVIWRYFLDDPIPWTDEVSRMLFVWLAYVGAAIGVKRGLHASVAVLTERMGERSRQLTALFGIFVIAVVALLLFIVGSEETYAAFARELMPITRISAGWTKLALPASGALMLIYLAPHLRRRSPV